MRKIELIFFAIIIVFIVVLSWSLLNHSLTVNNYEDDIVRFQNDIGSLKSQLENTSKKLNESQELLKATQNQLKNSSLVNITVYPKSRIYDVNRDGVIDFNDVKTVLNYTNKKHSSINLKFTGYNLLYDINVDHQVNTLDAEEIWANRD